MKSLILSLTGSTLLALATLVGAQGSAAQNESEPGNKNIAMEIEKHAEGAKKLAFEQDELSADVQDLIDEQTDPKVIELLREIEVIMADATDLLEQTETGGTTIAVETEVIEKIFEAAKRKKEG